MEMCVIAVRYHKEIAAAAERASERTNKQTGFGVGILHTTTLSILYKTNASVRRDATSV